MRAIVEISGKQYPVQEGRYVLIDSYNAPEAAAVTLDKVQMILAGEHSLIGAPFIEGASVKATVKRHGRGNKVLVYKMRCKKGYRRKNGHRQGFTELQIESLDFPGKDKIVALLPKEEPAAPKAERAPKVAPAAKLTNSEKNQGTHAAPAKPAAKPAKAEKAEPKAEAPKAKVAEEAPKAEAAKETKPKKAAAPKAKASEDSAEKPAKSTTAKKSTKKADEAAPAAEAPADSADKGAE